MSYVPPVCSVEGCSNIADHTDVKFAGQLWTWMCEEHYQWIVNNSHFEDPARSKCCVPGCYNLTHNQGKNKHGINQYRKVCYYHHQQGWEVNRDKGDSETLTKFMVPSERLNYGDLNPFLL